MASENKYLNRPPRIQPEFPSGEVAIPNPPTPSNNTGRLSLVTVFIPLVTIVGYALVASRGGNLLLILPMGFVAVPTSIIAYLNWRRLNRVEQEKIGNYNKRLKALRSEMEDAHRKQALYYQINFPAPDELLRMASGGSTRLWERRPEDTDFAAIRLGVGQIPSSVVLKLPSAENSESPQLPAAIALAAEFANVSNASISVSLRQQHAVGIAGVNVPRDLLSDFGRAILVHLTGLHTPNDMRLYVIGTPDAKPHWDWARLLPHCRTVGDTSMNQLCFEPKQFAPFWAHLQAELEHRQMRREAKKSNQEGTDNHDSPGKRNSNNDVLPFLVILVDLFTAVGAQAKGTSPVEGSTTEATVAMLLTYGQQLGASIVFITPDQRYVPSECGAVIKLQHSSDGRDIFKYEETGLNTTRYEGLADRIDVGRVEKDFAQQLMSVNVRSLVGSELPGTLSLADLLGIKSVAEAGILENWRDSRKANSDWPEAEIGVTVSGKSRRLVFETQNGDGVHGLIAGTTGSGKSELLLTIVLSLALRYDPSIVNFVLVDYKGGTTFEPLRALPHTVDLITNLQGKVGTRAFVAIRAELNRRQRIITQSHVTNIAEYHQQNYHVTIGALPHLFIIIDEFAEMIKERAEFKTQLESIAILGRALGVHLILATQRPSGVVSEQISSNMKFRICLRVESADDSRELLGRADAQFLPRDIPGRAYLRVGGEVTLIQVARVGGQYQGPALDLKPTIVWLDKQQDKGLTPLPTEKQRETFADVLVRLTDHLANKDKAVIRQPKPWPDPLPEWLPLRSLDNNVNDWLEGRGTWAGVKWTGEALRTQIGLVDYPSQALQFRLWLNLIAGHWIILGESRSGKTTLVRTLITGLTASHSPRELWLYFLDFGGRGLDVFNALPHLGANIVSGDPDHPERLRRLFRRLASMMEERKVVLSQAKAASLSEYNAGQIDRILPAILLVIDNVVRLREDFPDELDMLATLMRDGQAYGLHVIVTAEQITNLPIKVFNLFSERLALKMTDPSEYSTIVGRNIPDVSAIKGRGYWRFQQQQQQAILEFQTALSVGAITDSEADRADDFSKLAELAGRMKTVWSDEPIERRIKPESIEILSPEIALDAVIASTGSSKTGTGFPIAFGMFDQGLEYAWLDLRNRGPHLAIIGPPLSGKTTTVRTLTLALATLYKPTQVNLVLIDFQRRLFEYGGQRRLNELPHVQRTVTELPELEQLIKSLQDEFALRRTAAMGDGRSRTTTAPYFVLIDNYDDLAGAIGINRAIYTKLGDLARQYGSEGLYFIVAGSNAILRTGDDFIRRIAEARYGLGLDAGDALSALGGRVRSSTLPELPAGRGYLVKSGRAALVQVATPCYEYHTIEDSLDQRIDDLCHRDAQSIAE